MFSFTDLLNIDVQFEIFKYLHYQDLFNLENAAVAVKDERYLLQLQMWWDRVYKLKICDDFSFKKLPTLMQKTLNLREIDIEHVADFEQFVNLLITCNANLEKISIKFDYIEDLEDKKLEIVKKFVNLKYLSFSNVREIKNYVVDFVKFYAHQLVSLELEFNNNKSPFKFFSRSFKFENLKCLKLKNVFVLFDDYDADDDIEKKFKNLKSLDMCIYNTDQLNFIVKYMRNLKNLTLTFTKYLTDELQKYNFKNFFSILLLDNKFENLILKNFQSFINAELHLFLHDKVLNLEYDFTLTLKNYIQNDNNFYNSLDLYAKNVLSLKISKDFFKFFFCNCSFCRNQKTAKEKQVQKNLLHIFENIKTLDIFSDYEFYCIEDDVYFKKKKCLIRFDDVFVFIYNKILYKNVKVLNMKADWFFWERLRQ